MPPADPAPEHATYAHTVRQTNVLITGWVVIAILLLFAVGGVLNGSIHLALVGVGAALVLWAVFVRPNLRYGPAGLLLDNVVRRVRMPWPRVDLIESRWNLQVFTPEGSRYTSWAISAQRPQGGPSLVGGIGRIGRPTAPETVLTERPASAASTAGRLRAGQEEYERAVRDGHVEVDPADVRVELSPVGAAATALGALLVVLGVML